MVSKEEQRAGPGKEEEDPAGIGQSEEQVQQVPTSEYTCWTEVPLFLFNYIPKVSCSR